jgi:lincosamide nucleotidyltransferase A/C/D/E
MSERDAGRLCRLLDQHELRYWVVGGWGVDALLGEVTREHNDLDLLLVGSQHATTWRLLHDHGFALAYTWEENVDVPGDLVEGTQPTAYVLRDSEGRELDVHVLDECEGVPRPIWSTDRPLVDGALDARGWIDRTEVPCISVEMQLRAHEGYELPAPQLADVDRLRQLEAAPAGQVVGRDASRPCSRR